MKKKLLFFGLVLIALLLTSSTFAYTFTNSNTALTATLAGDFATYQVSPNQPDWNLILPGTSSEILVPNDCGDETQLPTQNPSGGSHWEKVDDQPSPDEGSTYVSTQGSNNWKRDLYNLSDYVHASGTEDIKSVTVYFRIASGDSYPVSAKGAIRIASETFEGSIITQSNSSYTNYSWELTYNPATGNPWAWDEINDLQAGVSMKGYSTNKPAICTQVYVKVDYQNGVSEGAVPVGELFIVKPDALYTGDLLVKIYITNTADLLKAYQYLNMKIYVTNSIEAGKIPNYQILSLENGVATFDIIGGSALNYRVQLVGGSYNLVSSDPDNWGAGWTLTPDFYCEVSQR
jgi:hypothetical protein